jgi:hypothetical protein
MSNEIFEVLHGLSAERYGLQPSLHMATYESLVMFLFTCARNESGQKVQSQFKLLGETITKKFDEVLNSLMAMAKDFIRPKDSDGS